MSNNNLINGKWGPQLNPQNYTVEEAEFLFNCELNQLKKRELISEEQHESLSLAHQQLSQQRKEQRKVAMPQPVIFQPKTAEEKRLERINLFLILGTLLLALAGLIFSTATWMVVDGVGRGLILALNIMFLFGVSLFSEKKLKLQKTATTFWNLALCLTPLIILTLSAFGALGDYFSFSGDGRFLLGTSTSLLMIGLTHLSYKRFKQETFLLVRHLFEILTQAFVWVWISSSLELESIEQWHFVLIGWGIFLLAENFIFNHKKIEQFQIPITGYMKKWLPYKQLIFQWGTTLLTFLHWGELGYNSFPLVLAFISIIMSFGLTYLSSEEQKRSYTYTIPFGINLLVLGNFWMSYLDFHLNFVILNVIFGLAYLGLTYGVKQTHFTQTLRQCFRGNLILYLLTEVAVNSSSLDFAFFCSWLPLGFIFIESLIRNRNHQEKEFILYLISSIWFIIFGSFVGLNLDSLSIDVSLLIGAGLSLIFQTIWLSLRQTDRDQSKGYCYIITSTLITLNIHQFSENIWVLISSLIVLGLVIGFLLYKLSFQPFIKPWGIIILVILNLFTLGEMAIAFIHLTISILLMLLSVIRFFNSDLNQKEILDFSIKTIRINAVFLFALYILNYDYGFSGVLTLQSFALALSFILDTIRSIDLQEKATKLTCLTYLISFFISSLFVEWIRISEEDLTMICLFLPLVATIFNNRFTHQGKSRSFQSSEFIYLIIFNIALIGHSSTKEELIYLLLAFSFYITQLIIVQYQSDKKYRSLAMISFGIFIFIRFLEFFTSIHWLIYLIVIGIGLVVSAMRQEFKSRKEDKDSHR